MSSFMNKALAYLGLKDIEDDELYGDALEPTGQHRIERTVYPATEDTGSHPSHATVRPITAADPRRPAGSTVVRPITKAKTPAGKVHVVAPSQFRDAQEIGDVVKQGNPVIVNLQGSERESFAADDRFLLGTHLRARRADGEGGRSGLSARSHRRRGSCGGASAPARARPVPLLIISTPTTRRGAARLVIVRIIVDVLQAYIVILLADHPHVVPDQPVVTLGTRGTLPRDDHRSGAETRPAHPAADSRRVDGTRPLPDRRLLRSRDTDHGDPRPLSRGVIPHVTGVGA